MEVSFSISAAQYVERHAVLDAAGKVQVLTFRVNGAMAAPNFEIDGEERGIADEWLERANAICDSRFDCGDE